MSVLRQLAWNAWLGRGVTLVAATLAGSWIGSGPHRLNIGVALFVAAAGYAGSLRRGRPTGLRR